MSNYSIYILDEADLTVSGGGQLDGVTGGNGSHLVGLTITLNTNSFHAINITDGGTDISFADNDGNQRLNGAQTIDGISYADGAKVEAEYQITVQDPDGATYTLIGFNVVNSSPSYATVEGLSFIGTFPPIGVPLTVISNAEGPSYLASQYAVPCFTAGTLVRTEFGDRPIEDLAAGDRVETLENGLQEIRWVGKRTVAASGAFAPVLIRKGALGNTRDLLVSRNHRMLIADWRAQLFLGQETCLIAAKQLVDDKNITFRHGGSVTYVHLLFGQHEIIFAENCPSESFYPGLTILSGIEQSAYDEVIALFPELEHPGTHFGPAASTIVKRHESRLFA